MKNIKVNAVIKLAKISEKMKGKKSISINATVDEKRAKEELKELQQKYSEDKSN